LKERIKSIAETRVRYGYRRIHVVLRREGWVINDKRVHRLYREMGLQNRHKTRKRWVKAKLRDDRQAATGNVNRRAVLIHGQFAREDQIDAFKRLDVIPSLFPMHTFYWGDWHRDHTVGPTLSNNISPTGWAVKRGMRFTSHHDAPVAFPESMRVLDATVTRRSRSGDIIGPDQRVDVITALKSMTLWSAYQHFEEGSKGSIEVGKLAGLVILSGGPTAIDPETIDTLKVVETIKEGETVFALTDAAKRQGDLMHKPNGSGRYAFAELLRQMAIDREFRALPVGRQTTFARTLMATAVMTIPV
jgi:hypothetical protein